MITSSVSGREPNNRGVIYSAMTGNYDIIFSQPEISGWDYVFFTDRQPRPVSPWDIRSIDKSVAEDDAKINRWYKMHPHVLFPEYEHSIYIDSNIRILYDFITKRVEDMLNRNIKVSAPKHGRRNCIYDEAKKLIMLRLDSEERICKTVEYLKKEKYPANNGLFDNSFIFRRHNDPDIIALMEEWWLFLNEYARRDQLTLFYLLWKKNITYEYFLGDTDIRKFNSVKYYPHFNGRWVKYYMDRFKQIINDCRRKIISCRVLPPRHLYICGVPIIRRRNY